MESLNKIPCIDLFPVYVHPKISNYPWVTDFIRDKRSYVLNRTFFVDWAFLSKLIFKERQSYIVVAGWNNPTTFLLLTLLALLRRNFFLHSDTPNVRLRRRGLLQFFRRVWLNFIYQRMCQYLVTGAVGVDALTSLNVASDKIINFPFATNTDFFVPPDRPCANDEIILFSSGRLDIKHKGYDIVIRALGELKAEDPSIKFHYYIAGSGPDEVVIRSLINKYRISDNVTLLGWLEPNVLLNHYQQADFFIHPSNFDPYPNAVLEAMACGLPVIGSTLAGSVVDRVSNGLTGYIFNVGDINDLKRWLEVSFDTNEEERKAMKLNCRSVALQWRVDYHIKVFERLLERY